jgi:hypothetical protein
MAASVMIMVETFDPRPGQGDMVRSCSALPCQGHWEKKDTELDEIARFPFP